jgi:hypothetical protein
MQDRYIASIIKYADLHTLFQFMQVCRKWNVYTTNILKDNTYIHALLKIENLYYTPCKLPDTNHYISIDKQGKCTKYWLYHSIHQAWYTALVHDKYHVIRALCYHGGIDPWAHDHLAIKMCCELGYHQCLAILLNPAYVKNMDWYIFSANRALECGHHHIVDILVYLFKPVLRLQKYNDNKCIDIKDIHDMIRFYL